MTFFYVYPHVPQSNPHAYNPYKIPIESLSLIFKSNKSSLDGEPTPRSEPTHSWGQIHTKVPVEGAVAKTSAGGTAGT